MELKKWVDAQYDEGRVTVLTDEELVRRIDETAAKLGVSGPSDRKNS